MSRLGGLRGIFTIAIWLTEEPIGILVRWSLRLREVPLYKTFSSNLQFDGAFWIMFRKHQKSGLKHVELSKCLETWFNTPNCLDIASQTKAFTKKKIEMSCLIIFPNPSRWRVYCHVGDFFIVTLVIFYFTFVIFCCDACSCLMSWHINLKLVWERRWSHRERYICMFSQHHVCRVSEGSLSTNVYYANKSRKLTK